MNVLSNTKIKGSKIKKSRGEIIFDVVVYAIAALFCVYCLYPFAIILGSSFETESNFATYGFPIIPKDFTLKAYQMDTGIYKEGVLTVDMVNTAEKVPLFSASVATIMDGSQGQYRNLKSIAEAVQTLFSKFPVAIQPQYKNQKWQKL